MKYFVNMTKSPGFYRCINAKMILIKSVTSYIDKQVLFLSRKFCYVHTRFSLISAPGDYLILKL